MKCQFCRKEFSQHVIYLHQERCLKNPKNMVIKPEEEPEPNVNIELSFYDELEEETPEEEMPEAKKEPKKKDKKSSKKRK